MTLKHPKTPMALAVASAIGSIAMLAVAAPAVAGKAAGQYMAGDFHNHTTCSDGAVSMQKAVKKSMDRNAATPWGLDWFVQAGHGGTGNRNCTLPEDAAIATPAYPLVTGTNGALQGPTTSWQNTNPAVAIKGDVTGTSPDRRMWRWQSIQEYQYPVLEYLAVLRNEPLFIGLESVVAGHEHTSMAVITGQMPASAFSAPLPTQAGYTAKGNANAQSMWTYCFDRNTSDTSRGNTFTGGVEGNNWDCSVPGGLNNSVDYWNESAKKLVPNSTTAVGEQGHLKTVEALKWMKQFHGEGSYYVPAHLERAGPFNPAGNNGFNIEHLRNFNNAAPRVAFGFESQPGHGASQHRGEYRPRRNTIGGVRVDSVGGTTFGGTGVYAAQVGGVWDALLGEGRNWYFFASSDWHNRGTFSVDDRRSTQDFWPGEYQRNYTMVRNAGHRVTPQTIVDGLRTGNTWAASGQLIDRLAFVACASYGGPAKRSNAAVETIALAAAMNNTDIDVAGCATMGEKLTVRPGAEVVVSLVVRDPSGKSYSPYSFANPSLVQVGIQQPLDKPVLHHVDLIRGMVSGMRTPGAADYAGAWPDDWVDMANPQQLRSLDVVPAAAKNTTAAVIGSFSQANWRAATGNPDFKVMTYRISAVQASQYVRVRGTNLPPAVPFETDANGNPLADLWTNQGAVAPETGSGSEFPASTLLRIPCTSNTGSNVPEASPVFGGDGIDACPRHLPVVNGTPMVAFDVAAWADLWFYSNPIFVEVAGRTQVAGLK